jgi:hypothetical protein
MKHATTALFVSAHLLASCGSKTTDRESQAHQPNAELAVLADSGEQITAVATETLAPLYTRPLTEADIERTFGVAPGKPVTRTTFENFLAKKVKIAAADATQAANAFLKFKSNAFIPDDQKRQQMLDEGFTQTSISDGLTPTEYLAYLRIAHGDGPCPASKAGSPDCPARVIDFQMSLITNQNGIFNLRTAATKDSQYDNTLSIHRESQANRQTFAYIGQSLGQGSHPLRGIVIDPNNAAQCSELQGMLGSSTALQGFLTETVGVNPTVAAVAARQWANTVTEVTKGVTYVYGFAPFLSGRICSRDTLGACYSPDPRMTKRLVQLVPDIANKTTFTCREIAQTVNTLASMPSVEPIDFSKPVALPFDQSSPNLTADELFDFFVALGNALTNRPDAPFADIIPLADLNLLNASGIANPEYQFTSQVNRYFHNRYVGR